MAKSRRVIGYHTINAKVLPAKENQTQRYVGIIENWFSKGYKIMHEGDSSHYFTLTTLDRMQHDNSSIFYGVLSKFVKIDNLDFVNSDSGQLVEFELPSNVEARSQQYEFVFIPTCHRFAFIKSGKIDPDIRKRGAPLKQIMNIIKLAFDSGVKDQGSSFVEIEQDDLIFEDIYLNRILSLQLRVTYTNDDHLNDESKKLMDGLLKEGNIAQLISRMTPDNKGVIDSSSKLTNGLIGLAKENGEVNALVEYEDGSRGRIKTKNHPAVAEIAFSDTDATKPNFLIEIFNRFISRYK